MDFEQQGRMAIPGFDEPVLLYDEGERRMGAYLIVITTPCLIGGVSRFVTVNGHVYYSAITNSLINHDACTILRFHLPTKRLEHLSRPPDSYFSKVTEDKDGYWIWLYGNGPGRYERLGFDDAKFVPGPGDVKNDIFPSASLLHGSGGKPR